MANIGEYAPSSGRVLREDNTFINMADIQGATVRSGSLIDSITITTAITTLRVGTADLTNRHSLMIINDSSTLVYIGLDTAMTTSTGFLLNSGTGIAIKLDPNDPISVYALTSELTTNIKIMELK